MKAASAGVCQDILLRNLALAIIWSLRMQMVRADLVYFPRLGLRVPKRSHLEFDRLAKSRQHVRAKASGLGQLPGGRERSHAPLA